MATEDVGDITLDIPVALGRQAVSALMEAIERIEDVLESGDARELHDDFRADHEALRHLYNQMSWVYGEPECPPWKDTKNAPQA